MEDSNDSTADPNDWFPTTSYTTALYAIYGCLLGVIAVVGLIGNALSLLVWKRESGHGSTAFLLQALSVVDSVYLITLLAYTVIPMQLEYFSLPATKTQTYKNVITQIYRLVLVSKTMTVWMVVFVSIDRYIGVCHPLRATRWCRIRYSKIGVMVLVACSVVYNAAFWIMSISARPISIMCDLDDNSTTKPPKDNDTDRLKVIIQQTCFELVHFVIPLFVLLICNVKLCQAIRLGDQIRANLVSTKVTICSRTSVTVTRTLIMIVVLFLVLETPGAVIGLIYLITVISGPCSDLTAVIDEHFSENLYIFKPISDIMLNTNSAINFFVYCLMVRKFRCVLTNIVTCRRDESPLMPTQGTTSDV